MSDILNKLECNIYEEDGKTFIEIVNNEPVETVTCGHVYVITALKERANERTFLSKVGEEGETIFLIEDLNDRNLFSLDEDQYLKHAHISIYLEEERIEGKKHLF